LNSEKELLKTTGQGLTVEHIIPLSKGGTNYIDNIVPACRFCNLSKNNRIWMHQQQEFRFMTEEEDQ